IAACDWSNLDENVLTIKGAVVPDEHHELIEKDHNKSFSGTRKIILVAYAANRLHALKATGIMSVMLPSSVIRCCKLLCLKNDLPEYTMHSLRHYHASVMLALNIPDKYAMEILGQNSPHMLKKVYQHTFSKEFLEVNRRINQHY